MNETELIPALLCAAPPRAQESVVMDGTTDITACILGDADPGAGGKMLALTVKIRNVLPGRRVALGVILSESGPDGAAEPRGLRVMTVPAHREGGSRDILVKDIRFVLPDDISLSSPGGRRFSVRTIAHYISAEEAHICSLPADGPCPVSASDA